MLQTTKTVAHIGLLAMSTAFVTACQSVPSDCGTPPSLVAAASSSGTPIGLSERLAEGRLKIVNRQATALPGGSGLRVTAAPGVGLIWIDGTNLADGAIEADVCGRDVDQESFLGIAFHRQNDQTYEAVYVRPFNFRSRSSERRQHAVQYVAMPSADYARLRQTHPGEFEKSVDGSVNPSAWNRLRIVVRNGRVQAFVGNADTAALDIRELQSEGHGQVGLFVDNGSDGVFANLRIVPSLSSHLSEVGR